MEKQNRQKKEQPMVISPALRGDYERYKKLCKGMWQPLSYEAFCEYRYERMRSQLTVA
jgi:hypothetical protein